MQRRIFGIENEYGVTCTFHGQRRLSPDEVARYLFRRVVSWGRSSNVFLKNGARLYLDVGSHPEYATPECDSLDEPGRPRQGRRADPRGPGRRRREAAARRGHRRRHLPVQEQHRLGRQLLRLPRELPGRPARRVQPAGRRADPVPRHPAADLRRRQGAADPARRGVLRQPARRAHLGGRLVGDHPQPSDHQHPRRAARRRRALPPPARDRRRLEHERVDHDAQGRLGRPGAADDRARRHVPRPHAGEPDPGDPRDQPRPHRHPAGPAGRRPHARRALEIQREYYTRAVDFVDAHRRRTRRPSGCSSCGAARSTPSSSRTCR